MVGLASAEDWSQLKGIASAKVRPVA